MKKTFHFIIIAFLVSIVGSWGEAVELIKDNFNSDITEVNELKEEERKKK